MAREFATLHPACGTQVEGLTLFGALLDLRHDFHHHGEDPDRAREIVAWILDTDSPAHAARRLTDHDYASANTKGPANPLVSALRLEIQRDRLTPTRQLTHRAGRVILAPPTRAGLRPRPNLLLPAHRTHIRMSVAQLKKVPLPVIADHTGQPIPTDVVRILLAKLGRPDTWADLATGLDLDRDLAFTIGPTLRTWHHTGAWNRILTDLEAHLAKLEHESVQQ